MQRGRRVCSKVGECAARSESVQQGRRVCSEVGECAARLNKVYRVGPCAAINIRKPFLSKSLSNLIRPAGFNAS